jgi:macrolide transport system ATP-binding/permease protein
MRWLYKLPLRIRSLFERDRVEQELSDELRFHMEKQIEEEIAQGATAEEARFSALRELGGVEQIKEECRDMRRVNFIENLIQDLHYGLRMLRKSPSFTAIAVLSLGLGIGANTTIFSFVNALLFRPPAVEARGELLEIRNENSQGQGLGHYMPLSYGDYVYYRDHNQVFSGVLAFDGDPQIVTWNRSGVGERAQGALISGNYFSVLGVKPALGRTFLADEDRAIGEHPVIVLNHAFWQQRLGSDPQGAGEDIQL